MDFKLFIYLYSRICDSPSTCMRECKQEREESYGRYVLGGVAVVGKKTSERAWNQKSTQNQTMRLAMVFNPRVSVHCTCLRVSICVSEARTRAVGEAESDTVKRFCVMHEDHAGLCLRSVCVCSAACLKAACEGTLLCGSANILVKISHSLFSSTRLKQRERTN